MHGRRTEICILLPQLCVRLIDLGDSLVYVRYAFKVPGRSWRSSGGKPCRQQCQRGSA